MIEISDQAEVEEGWAVKSVQEKVKKVKEILSSTRGLKSGRLRRATLNQQLAEDFYRALSSPTESSRKAAKEFIEALNEEVNLVEEQLDIKIQRVLSGARVQAGVRDCLARNNFWTMVPVTQKEIALFDLQGVDLVAVNKRGEIFFLDLKAQGHVRDENGLWRENTEVRVSSFKSEAGMVAGVLQGVIGKIFLAGDEYKERRGPIGQGILRYSTLTVSVPSGRKFISFWGEIINPEVEKSLLENLEVASKTSWI